MCLPLVVGFFEANACNGFHEIDKNVLTRDVWRGDLTIIVLVVRPVSQWEATMLRPLTKTDGTTEDRPKKSPR